MQAVEQAEGERAFEAAARTIEELAEVFEAVGLGLSDVYDEHGAPWAPSAAEQQLDVEARG